MPEWIGPWEIAIVLVIALLIFGPKKLPDLGSSLGKSISGFKRGLKDAQDEMKTAMTDSGPEQLTSAEAPAVASVAKTPVAATMTTTTAAQPGSTEQS
jgi:sec-independent protein translocase protein TatA